MHSGFGFVLFVVMGCIGYIAISCSSWEGWAAAVGIVTDGSLGCFGLGVIVLGSSAAGLDGLDIIA